MKNQNNDNGNRESGNDSRNYKILILEDSEHDVEFITRKLKKAGLKFEYKDVDEVDEFEQAVKQWLPDLIISDHNISGKYSGKDALQFTKQHYPDIPFISVSGVISKKMEIELLANRADDVIQKDHLDRLPFAVKRVLRQKQDAKELLNKTERLVDLLLEKEVLVKEIHHRVKHNLALFSSFLELDKMIEDDPNVKSALDTNILRVKAIGIVHELVYDFEDYVKIPLARTITKVFELHLDHDNISIMGDSIVHDYTEGISNLIPLGLFINEILTQLNKQGVAQHLKVRLQIGQVDDHIKIHIISPVFTENSKEIFSQKEERIMVLKTLLEQFGGDINFYPEQSLTILSFKKVID